MDNLTTKIYYNYIKYIKEKLIAFDVESYSEKHAVISFDRNFKSRDMNNFASLFLFVKDFEKKFLNKMIRIYRDRAFYNERDISTIINMLEHQGQMKTFFQHELQLQEFKIFRRKYICDNL